jgi:hypothetical protein
VHHKFGKRPSSKTQNRNEKELLPPVTEQIIKFNNQLHRSDGNKNANKRRKDNLASHPLLSHLISMSLIA